MVEIRTHIIITRTAKNIILTDSIKYRLELLLSSRSKLGHLTRSGGMSWRVCLHPPALRRTEVWVRVFIISANAERIAYSIFPKLKLREMVPLSELRVIEDTERAN